MQEKPVKSYDFTISFAGQDREYAENIVIGLKSKGATVFYDNDEQADLLGKDLYEHLITIYRDSARYCVMLISEHYQNRLWTNHERKAAQSRAFRSSSEYILPIRLDDSDMTSLLDTVGYLDYKRMGNEKVVSVLISKLWGSFVNEPALKKLNESLKGLYQRVGLICEYSLRPCSDPEINKVLPFDIIQGGNSMIRNIKETLKLKQNFIDHAVMEKLLEILQSCEILIDLCVFIVQRLDYKSKKLRVIEHPNQHFFNLIELNNLLNIKDTLASKNSYFTDFQLLIEKWSVSLTESNKVVSTDSEALAQPRNDLLVYDTSTLRKIPGKVNGQILEVYRTIDL